MNKKMRELLERMKALTTTAELHTSEKKFDDAENVLKEIGGLQREYEIEKKLFDIEAKGIDLENPDNFTGGNTPDETEKAFIEFCQSGVSKALDTGSNGVIIPKTIAKKIIDRAFEISTIVSGATRYNVKGDLSIPAYSVETDDIEAGYGAEFQEIIEHQGNFISNLELKSHIVNALAKMSKKLMNNTDVDVLGFVIEKVAQKIAIFFEKEMLTGDGATGHFTGAVSTKNIIESATITSDILVDMQLVIPKVYQKNAKWIMSVEVFKKIRKLKDNDGKYMLIPDFAKGGEFTVLGKPVEITENMPTVAVGNVPIMYGDMTGMALKVSKDVEIQVLREKYATQNAIGVLAYAEADSGIENSQKFVALKMIAVPAKMTAKGGTLLPNDGGEIPDVDPNKANGEGA